MVKIQDKDKLSEGGKMLIEDLADLEHQQWSHWMNYFFSLSERERIIKEPIWRVQAQTKYQDLSEEDKEKDRIWARKVLMCQWDSANKEIKRREQHG